MEASTLKAPRKWSRESQSHSSNSTPQWERCQRTTFCPLPSALILAHGWAQLSHAVLSTKWGAALTWGTLHVWSPRKGGREQRRMKLSPLFQWFPSFGPSGFWPQSQPFLLPTLTSSDQRLLRLVLNCHYLWTCSSHKMVIPPTLPHTWARLASMQNWFNIQLILAYSSASWIVATVTTRRRSA